jgi:plastocyanin
MTIAPQPVRSALLLAGLVLAAPAPARAQQFQHQVGAIPGTARWSEGVECADVDKDGDLDIFFADGDGFSSAGTKRQNVLVVNKWIETGTFTFADESVARLGANVSNAKGVTTADVDGDGWVDALYCNAFYTDLPFLYMNRGAAQPGFFDLESAARGLTTPLSSGGAQFGDLDDDGDLDLIINDAYLGSPANKPRLYFNDGTGHFTENAAALGAPNKAAQMDVQLTDVDGDWDLDFFGVCRAGNAGGNHYLMLNDGTGSFTNVSSSFPSGSSSTYEADVGDLDGDTDVDMFMVSLSGFAEGVVRNDIVPSGTLSFASQPALPGFADDNEIALFDYDVDDDYDVLVGSLGGTEALWRNNGALSFSNDNAKITTVSDSTLDCTAADLDNDGRYDIVTAQGESNSAQWANKIYRNTGPVDDSSPVIVAVNSPAVASPLGPTKVHARVRDQVMDDGVSYVTGSARYVINTVPKQSAVTIQAGGFSPAMLNVTTGTRVVWTNSSGTAQSVTSTTAPYTYDSGSIAPGGTFEYSFVAPGTYDYASTPSGLTGQVVVTGSATTVAASHSGGGIYRASMPDTAAGLGIELVYELEFRDWPGNVTVGDSRSVTLFDCSVSTYCTAKVNSLFCTPAIGSSGLPSASAGNGFAITAANIINQKFGLFFYGTNGQLASPFQGGFLCAKAPTKRTPVQSSGGSAAGSDCTGSYSIDFNAWIASGIDPALMAGTAVDGQYWSRDPQGSFGTNLTDAIHFVICP